MGSVALLDEEAEAELSVPEVVLGLCFEAALLLAEADMVGDVAPAHVAS